MPTRSLPFVNKTNIIILANHGTVSYGENVERAYWWTEILDAYCRMLMLAKQLGRVNFFDEEKERELLDLKQKWGWSDPRNTDGVQELRHLRQRHLPRQLAEQPASSARRSTPRRRWGRTRRRPLAARQWLDDQEALVQMITRAGDGELAKR